VAVTHPEEDDQKKNGQIWACIGSEIVAFVVMNMCKICAFLYNIIWRGKRGGKKNFDFLIFLKMESIFPENAILRFWNNIPQIPQFH
jgi:hypothetical protein